MDSLLFKVWSLGLVTRLAAPGWSLRGDPALDPAPLAPWPPGLTDDRSVFAVLCGAQPAGPAQHPQVDGPSGELEGRRCRHAHHSAREGTLLPQRTSSSQLPGTSFPPHHRHLITSFAVLLDVVLSFCLFFPSFLNARSSVCAEIGTDSSPGGNGSLGCWEGAEFLSGAEATNGVSLSSVLCRAYGEPAARGRKTWESLNSLARDLLGVVGAVAAFSRF